MSVLAGRPVRACVYAPVPVPPEVQLLSGDGVVPQHVPRAVTVNDGEVSVAPRVAVVLVIADFVGDVTVGMVCVVKVASLEYVVPIAFVA